MRLIPRHILRRMRIDRGILTNARQNNNHDKAVGWAELAKPIIRDSNSLRGCRTQRDRCASFLGASYDESTLTGFY